MEEVRVAVLEQKIEDLKIIVIKIDGAIEKISEVNSNVSKMLAVHEERISKQEEADTILFAKIDKLRDKIDFDNNCLVSRIQKIEKRVWIALGVVYGLTFFHNNLSMFTKLLTPSPQASIMRYTDFKA